MEATIVMDETQTETSYAYEITMATGQRKGAGTTANVFFNLTGDLQTSATVPFSHMSDIRPGRTSKVTCTLVLPAAIGTIRSVHIWHDNTGASPSWFLSHVIIRDIQTEEKQQFVCEQWLAVESEDGKVDRVLQLADDQKLNQYKNLFMNKAANDLFDGHLWISVLAKPTKSSFTRVQRASCCVSLLFCTMITNAMFYNVGGEPDGSTVMIGPIKFSLRQLMVGIQSSVLIFPVNLLLVQIFRKSAVARDSCKERENVKSTDAPKKGEKNGASCPNPTCKKCLSRALHYFAWVLCFASTMTSATFTLFYSMQWGKETSNKWLISFLTSFIQDAGVSQPLKVLGFAVFFALIIKATKKAENKVRNIKDGKTDEDNADPTSKEDQVVALPEEKSLAGARRNKIKELRTYNQIWEIASYCIFIFFLVMVAYGHRDPKAFNLMVEMENQFTVQVCFNH